MGRALGVFALAAPLVSGCHLYFDDDPPDCRVAAPPARAPAPELRDPETGECQSFGGGGGGGGGETCDDTIPLGGADVAVSGEVAIAWPDWGYCWSGCEGLDEASCQASDGCRAIYAEGTKSGFVACWSTAQSGPVRGGGCEDLDAYECSRHDDCSAVYETAWDAGARFSRCQAESSTPCDSALIAPFYLRDPVSGICQAQGGDPCLPSEGAPIALPDWAICDGGCEALDEQSCSAADGCRPVYVDACPSCGNAILVFAACWGTAQSGTVRGGGCDGLDAYECSRHDDCGAVHRAGPDSTRDCDASVPGCSGIGEFARCTDELRGCYSDGDCSAGESCNAATACLSPPGCTPDGICLDVCYGHCVPAPAPACTEIRDERACIDAGCDAIYEGSGCTCADAACDCETWTFLSCADA